MSAPSAADAARANFLTFIEKRTGLSSGSRYDDQRAKYVKEVEVEVVKAWASPDGIPAIVFYEALKQRLAGKSAEDAADYAVIDLTIEKDDVVAAAAQYYRAVQDDLYKPASPAGLPAGVGSKAAAPKRQP